MNACFWAPFLKGFGTSLGLIMAIGAQNAFVLKQGLTRNLVLITILFCAFADGALITLGVAGFGTLITSNHLLLEGARWGGAIFLIWYGFNAFRAAFTNDALKVNTKGHKPGLKKTLLTLGAVSFLNPHAFLDTVVLVGSISTQFEDMGRYYFGAGAIAASFIWFLSLGLAAHFLKPLFEKPIAWKILDLIIAFIMWSLAYSLIMSDMLKACAV